MRYKIGTTVFAVIVCFIFSCDRNNHDLLKSSEPDTDNPQITILFPENHAQIGAGQKITIVADVTNTSDITDVWFFIDGELESKDESHPFIYEWDTSDKIGFHTLQVRAYDANHNMSVSDEFSIEINSSANAVPAAMVVVSPSSGTIDTLFHFDASGSHDKETHFSQLRYSWDWENDGEWDISNSTNYNPSHRFNDVGVYSVRLMVTDGGKLWDDTIRAVGIYETGTVRDTEGILYRTVKIGDQWWMAENLKSTCFRNGDPIIEQWAYDEDEHNVARYGRLYSWRAVIDFRNLAPYGWHIPSDEEVQTLIDYLGGLDTAGDKIKSADQKLWDQPLTIPNNESGFSAVPAGFRNARTDPYYDGKGRIANFWSSTDIDEIYSGVYGVNHYSSKLTSGKGFKYFNLSVRCVKD